MRLFDAGADGESRVTGRIATVPNGITAVRLVGLPVFAWLVLGPEAFGWAFGLLVAIAATDWLDGYVARRFDQVSRLGIVIDPLVDRLLVVTTVVVLAVAGLVPWVLTILVLARDVLVVTGGFLLFGAAVPAIPVSRLGKAATALLLLGLPMFLLAAALDVTAVRGVAWVATITGLALYYVAGVQYARAALALRGDRSSGDHDPE
ncbi:CDP-alcohol phosphatidyltransferase family protein [Egibacter rhizosphaerae]|uniref:CDP-alcohol phosphatidyltransferase family protein n=1 Tax=Egibacter rhizosphaerae TaxID=1670831 RepID=A0A411YK89_9ACTN|nr:CDP-alcohol phosphatidyltransferase family protein [Egibacter rhizosphaerae]QBI21603.1 CDP-alcohol phosphatidyltransferase family protein [Egibacter rhizosphaerae]